MKANIKKEVETALSNGDKRWKHLEVIHQTVQKDRHEVRNAIADLMDEGKVKVNLDPTNGLPIYALASRL